MDINISLGPSNSVAIVTLNRGETCVAEGGAMLAMRGKLELKTTSHTRSGRGLKKGLKRLISGESFFTNHFTATEEQGTVIFAPNLPGDMIELPISAVPIIASSGSWVCNESTVKMDMSWQGFKSFLSGEGVFWLKLQGPGKAVLSTFGAMYSIDVDGEYVVDTGHIVAFEETLNFKLSKAGSSWIGSFLGGEGFVCRFQGKGNVWCQSHQSPAFGQGLTSYLRTR